MELSSFIGHNYTTLHPTYWRIYFYWTKRFNIIEMYDDDDDIVTICSLYLFVFFVTRFFHAFHAYFVNVILYSFVFLFFVVFIVPFSQFQHTIIQWERRWRPHRKSCDGCRRITIVIILMISCLMFYWAFVVFVEKS